MKESQIHSALMAWLKKNGLFYVHSTFGKKATMTKDAPDFIIVHAGRAILVEAKTEKGSLTPGQKENFARIQERSGMVVHIVRSVEQAVSVVQAWLGVENDPSSSQVEVGIGDILSGLTQFKNLFIGTISGKDYVLSGDSGPGGSAKVVRLATAADLINIRRRT
jgi:hypothetical protein